MQRFLVAIAFVLLLILIVVPTATFAGSSRIDLTINQGPGYLLPTSPFYFMDVVKNNVRLLVAGYNSAHKAQVHLQIAGERIAEVKVMLEEKNMPPRALDLALASLAEHVEGARNELKQEKSNGSNVEKLADKLNTTVNAQKESLRILALKTDSEGSLKIKAKLAKIREIELEVEDEMAADVLERETAHELSEAIKDATQDAVDAGNKAANLQGELMKTVVVDVAPASNSGSKPTVAGTSTEKEDTPPTTTAQ